MSADPNKRKGSPLGAAQNFKRKRSGNDGKWMTPHQSRGRALAVQRGTVEPGDVGIWATCARGMEGKAARELQLLFDEYAEKIYGIQPLEDACQGVSGKVGEGTAGEEEDIESQVQKEVALLKSATSAPDRIFKPIRLHVECLLFTKTRDPVDPVELAGWICRDAKQEVEASHGTRSSKATRYLNRLTPMTASGRANEKDMEEVARKVLRPWFNMMSDREEQAEEKQAEEKQAHSFAIRVSSRHHNHLKRDDVIRQIASLIDEKRHKVDLTKPDKVILVDIFKTTLGMSVVDGDWNALKKYNLYEIYNPVSKDKDKQPIATSVAEKGE